MRRLTLILSDLYLQDDAEPADGPQVHDLPAFEWLLSVSDAPRHIDDWRAWLAARVPGQGRDSVLAIATSGLMEASRIASSWFATPVHLEARLDHVRLVDRGLLRLDAAERAAACADFARAIGAPYALHDGGERTFYLSGVAPVVTPTADPARLLGCDIGSALPGRDAAELRRLGAEMEMWLHGAAFNVARERAGKARVSSLWLWRGPPAGPWVPEEPDSAPVLLGGDPVIEAMIRHLGQTGFGPPRGFGLLDAGLDRVVVEFSPLTGGPHERLPALEEHWFVPAKAALTGGSLDEIEIVANDRVFRLASSARWRFWRRRAHWLARLGDDAKA